jgi:hypothetical protein
LKASHIIKWLGINLIISLLITFSYSYADVFSGRSLTHLYDDVLFSFLMACAISGTIGIIEMILDKRLPWLEKPGKRALAEILAVTVFAFAAAFVVNVGFYVAFNNSALNREFFIHMAHRSVLPLIIGYGITSFFLSQGFLRNWREQAVQAERMRTERFKGEAQLLRDQLNPHFLFNALNVLTNMVYEDADKSADYIRKLSKFYRYVLEVQDEELISLERELTFGKSYFLLQQSRFGSSALQLSLEVESPQQHFIPPMALQLLLENAIKHNKIEPGAPLHIDIRTQGGYLKVKNNIQRRTQPAESTGIGLKNIQERYKHLSDKHVKILPQETHFEVHLPLLKVTQA